MTWRPVVTLLCIALSSIVPIDPDPPMRKFINVEVAPYQKNAPLEIPFTYISNMTETTNITIYVSNGDSNEVPLYARLIEMGSSFSSTIMVANNFLLSNEAILRFSAWGYQFHVSQQLTIYAQQTIEVRLGAVNPQQISIYNHGVIDNYGVTRYLKETLEFSGFSQIIERRYYLDLDLSMLAINAASMAGTPVTITIISLLIADHLMNFPLLRRSSDYAWAYTNLIARLVNATYRLAFLDPFYVNPLTFISAHYPIAGYVTTNRLFLPKDRFRQLQTMPLKLRFTITMGNIYQIIYDPIYYAETALLGPCASAVYCLSTSTHHIDGGAWKEVVVNG